MTTRYLEIGDAATLASRAAQIDAAYMTAMSARLGRTAGQPIDTVVDNEGFVVRVPDVAITTACARVITRAGTAGGLIVVDRIVRRLHALGLINVSDAKLRSELRLVWRTELTTLAERDDTGDPDDEGLTVGTPIRTRG